ncbi:MAG: hypothetical protein NC390_00285 [Fusobacterium sp.]|nr:hypothetical protein [Fusobacterium sp.]
MAEILLSLTIIGVVAAITLPSLTGNINERTWNTQRKALFARMSQAIALMPALNGYGTYDSASSVDTVAETFITGGLSKVLKVNNVCGKDNVFDCGFASKITTLAGSNIDLPRQFTDLNPSILNGTLGIRNTSAAAFETVNGESILAFYNPNCASKDIIATDNSSEGELGYYMKHYVCANLVFDLNGSKGPNTVGKDIGVMSVLYPTDSSVVMPVPTHILNGVYGHSDGARECANRDSDNRLPNIEELTSMYYNRTLLDWSGGAFWSSNVVDSDTAWAFGFAIGLKYPRTKDTEEQIQCVKR